MFVVLLMVGDSVSTIYGPFNWDEAQNFVDEIDRENTDELVSFHIRTLEEKA